MDKFQFQLGEKVKLVLSGEEGRVKGRAEYESSPRSYYVIYKAADGRQTEDWWREDEIRKQ